MVRRVAVLVAAVLLAAGCTGSGASHPVSSRRAPAAHHQRAQWPSAAATRTENVRPGSTGWSLRRPADSSVLAGWCDHVSVLPGQSVRLYVSTIEPSYRVIAYRTGYYGSDQARQIWESARLPGYQQPHSRFTPATRTVSSSNWKPSVTVDTKGWIPGDYLFVLQGADGRQRWVPLTVRASTARGAVVIVNAVTTWNAYNLYGGYDLYAGGSHGAYADRSLAVSFDRPYEYGAGAADFPGLELPVVSLAEQLNLPLDYVTDLDIATDPQLLAGARAVISPGHDEYWTASMRDAITTARAAGTNIAFLGANASYRHIRLAPTPIGPSRLQIDYKTAADADPVYRKDPAAATFDWRAGPDPRPESVLTGAYYQCNGVTADMVTADPSSWLLAGSGLHAGERLTGLIGDEYDRVDLSAPTPRPLQILFHSALTCRGVSDTSDVVYYTISSGAGLFDAGTSSWVCALNGVVHCGPGRGGLLPHTAITAITTNLLRAFALGPAGWEHPARDNVAQFYPG